MNVIYLEIKDFTRLVYVASLAERGLREVVAAFEQKKEIDATDILSCKEARNGQWLGAKAKEKLSRIPRRTEAQIS
jgi:CRISPR/Cas system CMR-associated protein Cmr5 small subunit